MIFIIIIHFKYIIRKSTELENMEWFDLKHPSMVGSQGRMRFSVELLPKKLADSMANGSGQ